MESETNPNVALKPPPLNSDQLNYLIWRYLQEAGYGEAAVKLQRDWKKEPENLPFAKHIRGQALVSLVQKGLRYHHLSLTIDESGHPSRQLSPSTFFFGPESGRPASSSSLREPLYRPSEIQRASSPPAGTSIIPKKRELDSSAPLDIASGPAKRGRKPTTTDRNGNGNGTRKTSASVSDPPIAMELDQINGNVGLRRSMRSPSLGENGHDDSMMNGAGVDSRMDVEMDVSTPGVSGIDTVSNEPHEILPPLVHTLTNGESIGVQVAPAKVASLGPSTTVLQLPENLQITRNVWRPSDGSLLTVVGDHFCGAWRNATSNVHDDATKMVYQDLLSFSESSLITAVAWDPTGGLLAIATYSEQAGQLHLFDGRELILIENLPASQRAITSLKWLPSALRLIGIAPYEDQDSDLSNGASSTILLWDFSDMQFSASPLTLTIPEVLQDVDSAHHAGHGLICAAGGNAVYYCRASNDLLVEAKWTSAIADGDNWTFVKSIWHGNDHPVIVTASSESARLWLPVQNAVRSDAHSAPITGLESRPRAFQSDDMASIPEFATSSMDGTIKIWRFDAQKNSIDLINRLSIEPGLPILSLTFSPDGFCLAGASFGNARIWNAEHGYNLMASWEGTSEEWRGTTLIDEDAMSAGGLSSINGENGAMNTDHSLAWDADSKKLAFGLASQVAIIDFQR